jgi:hypothetical protein
MLRGSGEWVHLIHLATFGGRFVKTPRDIVSAALQSICQFCMSVPLPTRIGVSRNAKSRCHWACNVTTRWLLETTLANVGDDLVRVDYCSYEAKEWQDGTTLTPGRFVEDGLDIGAGESYQTVLPLG